MMMHMVRSVNCNIFSFHFSALRLEAGNTEQKLYPEFYCHEFVVSTLNVTFNWEVVT